MTPDLIILLIWVACGVAAYGFMVANFQKGFPRIAKENLVHDRRFGVFIGLFGPFGLGGAFLATTIIHGRPFKHGWKL